MDLAIIAGSLAVLVSLLLSALWARALTSIYRSIRASRDARILVTRRRQQARVSVVIAARNEAKNLATLLPRLISHGFYEVIVVDDASTDETPAVLRELASRYESLAVIRVDETPRGWAPKPYALVQGARRALGDVLFFLDADVEPFDAEALRGLVARVEEDEILGLVPRFLCRTRRCMAIEAAVTATAYGFYGLHRVMDPGDELGWMYGCCWAIRRETYWSLGGHGLVAGSYVEDRDLASEAKKRGLRVLLADARDTVGVWTYDSVSEFAWLIARLFVDPLHRRGVLGKVAAASATIAATYGPLIVALLAPMAPGLAPILLAPITLQLVSYAAGAIAEGYNPLYAIPGLLYGQLVYPLGLMRALRGRVYWKQRRVVPISRHG